MKFLIKLCIQFSLSLLALIFRLVINFFFFSFFLFDLILNCLFLETHLILILGKKIQIKNYTRKIFDQIVLWALTISLIIMRDLWLLCLISKYTIIFRFWEPSSPDGVQQKGGQGVCSHFFNIAHTLEGLIMLPTDIVHNSTTHSPCPSTPLTR